MTEAGPGTRIAFALASLAHALFLLALAGWLRPVPVAALTPLALLVAFRGARWKPHPALLALAPLAALALYPPIAFDETLYHLPFVRAFAETGELAFLTTHRFPVFPVLHELLCVPAYLIAGDVATHFVALVQLAVLVALFAEWDGRAGWVAAALFVGSPLVVHLATITYVDLALALFVAAGFLALHRERDALAGFFLGTACGVKYLGGFFAVAALAIVLLARPKAAWRFGLACALTALPMTLWIWISTGDPLFPFVRESVWALPLDPVPAGERALRLVRFLWDVTFARERSGLQPPVTPLLILLIALVLRTRWLTILTAIFLVVMTFLPQDSRYLVPLLALVCAVAATRIPPRFRVAAAIIAILPGLAYAGYRLVQYGPPPLTSAQREAWLIERVPEYRALQRAGTARVYACHAERLKSYAKGELLGDWNGPYSFSRVMKNPRAADVDYFLIPEGKCAPPQGTQLVYEDDAAQLWRVISP